MTIMLGDPVPWFFGARTVTGATIDLHVQAGRWVVLAFLGEAGDPQTGAELAALLGHAKLLGEQHLVLYLILPDARPDREMFGSISGEALGVIEDPDGALARQFGAAGAPRTIVLDPMLRAVANIAWDDPAGHAALLGQVLASLPPVANSAGVELYAPVLVVPRVFEFPLCDLLVDLYQSQGGTESGFLVSRDGATATLVDHRFKRRRDLAIGNPEVREVMRDRVVRRLVPAIERYFQFRPTRMDRYLVSCYDSATGGHFHRHRDNLLPGSRHRRFAVSINLNGDYQGCDLVFPEFGPRAYRAPTGGAVVFSTATLHQVTPIVAGRRFAFVPFLYGETDVAKRLEDNAELGAGSVKYQAGDDLLFPGAGGG
jgi:predicted 2-oxoglutarate/Fe(II)-dependent dioxygenase YbiX/peroxiredoxin